MMEISSSVLWNDDSSLPATRPHGGHRQGGGMRGAPRMRRSVRRSRILAAAEVQQSRWHWVSLGWQGGGREAAMAQGQCRCWRQDISMAARCLSQTVAHGALAGHAGQRNGRELGGYTDMTDACQHAACLHGHGARLTCPALPPQPPPAWGKPPCPRSAAHSRSPGSQNGSA